MAPPNKSQTGKPKSQTKLSSFFSSTKTENAESAAVEKPNIDKRKINDENSEDGLFPINGSPKSQVPKKRKRIIVSDDEDENISSMPLTLKSGRAPSTPRSQMSASKSPRSASKSPRSNSSKISTSYINSFRYDESDATSDSCFTDGQSSIVSTSSKKLTKKKKKGNESDGEEQNNMPHLSYEFLKPDKIKDISGNLRSSPDYDPRTLFIPAEFMKKQTPAHKQWWEIKQRNFDTVLFFKVGKFYEMFHGDAVIAVENLGLTLMRGSYAHCGFPEMAYESFANRLIQKGFKVARIEQTETPAQLEARNKSQKTKDKAVRRELCRITTPATQTYTSLESRVEGDAAFQDSNYLMSICEKKNLEEGLSKTCFGCAFIDCSVGQFFLTEFCDDSNFSTLRTLLAHNQPSQLLIPKNGLSQFTQSVINSILGPVQKEELQKKKEFLQAGETLKLLLDDDYLGGNIREWPEALIELVADPDEPIPKAKEGCELQLSALGGILWYLRKCLIDVDMVTMKKFEVYTPTTILQGSVMSGDPWSNRRMVLDGFALKSLHLLPPTDLLSRTRANLDKETKKFSLFNTVNHCATAFGRRLLRQWICAPSCDKTVLNNRQKAILFLCNPDNKALVDEAKKSLKKVPDLEHLFQRIHSLGLKYRSEKHPDSRAQFFEAAKYNTKKVKDLCTTLAGLEKLQDLIKFFDENYKHDAECPALLVECLGSDHDMKADLDHFKVLIPNREKVAKDGRIVPKPGMDPEYDEACNSVEEGEQELDTYLKEQKKTFKSSKLSYTGTGKNRYQLEIPEELTAGLSSNYELKSKRKGFKRYRTRELEELIANLVELEKKRDVLTDDSTRRVFADFDARKDKWSKVVSKTAVFDCLLSLATYASQCPVKMCVPEFDFESDVPYLELRESYHPLLVSKEAEFIPNDIVLGGSNAPVLLLSGANMSGKSTLMRQSAVLVVLAQIGSLVPAESMKFSPVDRTFSRIGASDCIANGQSTFFIELNETQEILASATKNSLVIIDELGRGTATYDGTAIAMAVLTNIADELKCRTLFSSHYHTIGESFSKHPGVFLGHMKCLVENDDINGDPSMDNITFLYVLASGSCPKSYGFFTARMAGIDSELVRRAYQASKMIEENASEQALQKLRMLKQSVNDGTISDEDLMAALKAN